MCGFFGVANTKRDIDELKECTNLISHRGPDDMGYVYENDLYLSHRRLSIIDLSAHGHQPMRSSSGKLEIIFNGEIYNFKKLKQKIETQWKSSSDTEVLLEYIERFGIKATLNDIEGMFSFALYDVEKKTVTLARDRFGEKPLYYGKINGEFCFSSELKPIINLKGFKKKISKVALRSFFAYNYVPAPLSIFEGIYKLEAGSYALINLNTLDVKSFQYWDRDSKSPFDIEDPKRDLNQLLNDIIRDQMIADVPIGSFLSGGVDSSLVSAIMQKNSSKPINTFTIGFKEKKFNEARFAKDVANHLGTNHTELYLTPKDCLSVVPLIPQIYDEPMSDSSQIPTYLVSKLAKSKVTVSLSGDGADEIFGGYQRYFLAPQIYNKFNKLPGFLSSTLAKAIEFTPSYILDKWTPYTSDKFLKLSKIMKSRSGFDLYEGLITHWRDDSPLKEDIDFLKYSFAKGLSFQEQMMELDSQTYLTDDILVKVDRAAMAVSLETRAPFLNHKVYEFSKNLSFDYKIKGNRSKCILRDILYDYVPKSLIERPKMGFGVPISSWLRNELRDWAESLLSEKSLMKSGLLNVETIRKKWKEHLSGTRDWQYLLWDVIVFQAWYDEYLD